MAKGTKSIIEEGAIKVKKNLGKAVFGVVAAFVFHIVGKNLRL
jgi:hypothetical protein